MYVAEDAGILKGVSKLDIYIARQPIFDRHMGLYGYELLYRGSSNNYYEGEDDSEATTELVYNAFLVMGFHKLTDGTKGFINFTQDLLESEIAEILPKDKVVVEILENVEAKDTVIDACKKLKDAGYTLALDDFIFNRADQDYTPLVELADMIKIEFPTTDKREQRKLLDKYKKKIIFLAEKVETREEYMEAVEMGYELFQGYFFSKPTMLKSKEIASLNIHLVHILEELQNEEPDFSLIKETMEKDMGLSYKLLKVANSIRFGGNSSIHDLRQALTRLGIQELRRWISIMLIKEFENVENSELIKICLLRGKLLSLISRELKQGQWEMDFFLTGLLSSIDVILSEDMGSIIDSLALSEEVKNALLGGGGLLAECLDCVLKYEKFQFDDVQGRLAQLNITPERYVKLYMEAFDWMGTTDE